MKSKKRRKKPKKTLRWAHAQIKWQNYYMYEATYNISDRHKPEKEYVV